MVTIPGIEANKIKRGSVIPFYVDYSEVSSELPLPQATSTASLTNDAEVSGFLEGFVYTRPVYDTGDPTVRQAVGSATYNVVLNYLNTTATGTDPCWQGSYSSVASFPYGNGELYASFSGSIVYQCPSGSPASQGTNSFVQYVTNGAAALPFAILPQATSPVLKGGYAVNIYTNDRNGVTETQKISNIQVWDRRAEFANNCDFGVNFTGCLTEYVIDTRRAKFVSKPPKGFSGEGVRI